MKHLHITSWLFVIFVVIGIFLIGRTKITFSPFSFKMDQPLMPLGIALLTGAIYCFYYSAYKAGYESKDHRTKENILEMLKDIEKESITQDT